jgi:hypothetical protein
VLSGTLGASDDKLQLHIVPGTEHMSILVTRFEESTATDFYLWAFGDANEPEPVIRNARYKFGPLLLKDGRVFAVTDPRGSEPEDC